MFTLSFKSRMLSWSNCVRKDKITMFGWDDLVMIKITANFHGSAVANGWYSVALAYICASLCYILKLVIPLKYWSKRSAALSLKCCGLQTVTLTAKTHQGKEDKLFEEATITFQTSKPRLRKDIYFQGCCDV